MPSEQHIRFLQTQTFQRTFDASTRNKLRRNEVLPPGRLPGEFFVIDYDRDTECFTLIVDDIVDGSLPSSYNLGDDIPIAMRYFRLAGIPVIGNHAIDVAREFGAAQAILGDGRVIPLIADVSTDVDVFKEPAHVGCLPQI
jgi:hypothetical protein